MNKFIDLISKVPVWLHENYAIACNDCTLIRGGMNVIVSARTTSSPHCNVFIKIFHVERSEYSVEQEGLLNNFLVSHNIAAAKALTSTAHTLSRLISIQHQKYAVLVFLTAKGRTHPLNHHDLTLCANSLFKLHQLHLPSNIQIPSLNINQKLQHMSVLSDLHFHSSELKQHYVNMLKTAQTQHFQSGLSICHGDPRAQNIFIYNNCAALIDFEHCCLSTPHLDLAIMIWNLHAKRAENSDAMHRTQCFIESYNQHSIQQFTFKSLAPYILFHEIWSVWSLAQHQLLTPHTANIIMKASYYIFSLLKYDLALNK